MKEYFFSSIKNNSLGDPNSEYLDGALSTGVEVPFLRTYYSKYGPEGMPDYGYIDRFVPNSFKEDYENKIYVNENGAVANAYTFRFLSDEEKKEAIESIIKQEQEAHPDYHYKMLEGRFPIDIDGGRTYDSGRYTDDSAEMSTHVLYITDYQNHLKSKTRIRNK